MRSIEAVVPSVALNVEFWKYIYVLIFWKWHKWAVGISWLEEFGFIVPHITIEIGSIHKVLVNVSAVEQLGNLGNPKVIVTILNSLRDWASFV
jgi:hypothetical protein